MHGDRQLIAAGLLLGAGLGGFFDGIVFHQILQWHNMLSARIPPVDLLRAKINMFWDGIFHAAVWSMTVAGLVLLFRAGRQPRAAWSGRVLLGACLIGWGSFNLIEGTIDHHLLALHHVRDADADPLVADSAFLAPGVVLAVGGWLLLQSGRRGAGAPQGRRG